MKCSMSLHGRTMILGTAPAAGTTETRLSRALAEMDAAIAYQKRVVESFRMVIADLADEVDTIGENLCGYQRKLDGIRIDRLDRKARRLARIADRWKAVSTAS